MVDSISLGANQTVSFTYTLTYVSPRLISIVLDDINTDTYTDIKTYSTDSCQKGYRTFTSDKGRDFPEGYVNLDDEVAQVQKQAEDDVKALLADVQTKIADASSSDDPQVTDMPGMDQILENWDQ